MKKHLLLMLTLSVVLFANYEDAVKLYEEGKYLEAFPIIQKEAKTGNNKAAEYRLAEMYEKGEGTAVNVKAAMRWYKTAAEEFAYVEKEALRPTTQNTFSERLSSQIGNDSVHAGEEYVISKVDMTTPETKSLIGSLVDGDFFGITPYKTNYIMPVSYSSGKPHRVSSFLPFDIQDTYNQNTEVKFQLSLKKTLSYNLFGFNEFINLAYTQEVWWQLYDESAPFRETNYRPELFMLVPSSEYFDKSIGLKASAFGFVHESNGQEGYRSRSWNRLYLKGLFQWDNLFLSARVWYRLPEDLKSDAFYDQTLSPQDVYASASGDDNPDINEYLGYGDIHMKYLYGEHEFSLMLRNNFDFSSNKGAVEFSYAYPLFGSPNSSWFIQIFDGYGESLIDYNRHVTKASFGFSLTSGLF